MPPLTVALTSPSPPGLAEATKTSTATWQQHLSDLYHNAKNRFPDVVWELADAEIWGHKAIVYARAPPSFQSRYFTLRPNPSQSAISLSNTPLLRIPSDINPALFSNELEFLYTAQGFGEAFDFLFDATPDTLSQPDTEDLRIDKLRKDLVFMWRSRLYSDIRIALEGSPDTAAVFSSHRFILVSRSSYFHDALLDWPSHDNDNNTNRTLNLPSPPFTPASLHFTLGFIYTGTLVFSHRTYDLSTAFAILKAALYLSLPSLHDEIQARIAHEMLHGLFHAFLPFQEYERLTQSKWGTGGCRCRQCARRVPRVLEFSLQDDVKNTHLERGSRRALVGLFGEGWCTQEFASLDSKLRESLLKGVGKRTTPQNVCPLLFAAEHAIAKLATIVSPWADTVREMILSGRKQIDQVISKESEASFNSSEWTDIMDGDGSRFGDSERVQWVMASILRGVKEPWAATLYQTLVSNILLKPHPTEPNAPFLSSTSQIRQIVEQTRVELSKWISKHWIQIRQENGFDSLEGWAIKEISDNLEVSVDDLFGPALPATTTPRSKNTGTSHRPVSNHPHTSRVDADTESVSSVRISILSRSMAAKRVAKDTASIASSIRTVRTVASTNSNSTIGTTRTAKERPDSKLSPPSPSTSRGNSPTSLVPKTIVTRAPVAKPPAATVRPKMSAASVRSQASTTTPPKPTGARQPISRPISRVSTRSSTVSTVSSRTSTTRSTLTSTPSRPVSSLSTTSTTSYRNSSARTNESFRTASSILSTPAAHRPRTSSGASITSVRTATTPNRTRKISAASNTSVSSITKSTASHVLPTPPPRDLTRLSPSTAKTLRTVKSGSSIKSAAAASAAGPATIKSRQRSSPGAATTGVPVPVPVTRPAENTEHKKTQSASSNATIKRKRSNETITTARTSSGDGSSSKSSNHPPPPSLTGTSIPRGATLDIGIPCIVSSKRKRFKAYARYIGEVEGEYGPWVGIEVPIPLGESWADRDVDVAWQGNQWNDGTLGGIRYFGIGSSKTGGVDLDSYPGDDRARRTTTGMKREGDQLMIGVERMKRMRSASPAISDDTSGSESRGLFVRPQQVLYVVDAVEDL